MNANTEISLEELHDKIVAAIRAKFPNLQTVEFYREDREQLPVPACLLDMAEFEDASQDPGTGQLAVTMRFEADFILGFRTEHAKLSARVLAAAFSQFISQRRWPGCPVGKAQAIHAYRNDFKPELDQYEVWTVEWRQEVNLGETVWKDTTTPTQIFIGFTPKIGKDHVADYIPVVD